MTKSYELASRQITIVTASTAKVNSQELKPFIDELLRIVAEVINEPGITSAFVSDDSVLWDFGPFNYDEVAQISAALGFTAIISEYVWKIAKKMKEVKQLKGEAAILVQP